VVQAQAHSGADLNAAVWDGSFFSVPMRLESADGFEPPAAATARSTNAKITGVSFAAPPASGASFAMRQPSPPAQQEGSKPPGRRRSALRLPASGKSAGEIQPRGVLSTADGGGQLEEFQSPPDPSRQRLTTEDGAALEPQPLLAGQGGSPKRLAEGGRQRGSSYDSSPSGSDADGGDFYGEAEPGPPARFVSQLLPQAHGAASFQAAAGGGGGIAPSAFASASRRQDSGGSSRLQRGTPSVGPRAGSGRRESDLIRFSDAGEVQPGGRDSTAAASSPAVHAAAQQQECVTCLRRFRCTLLLHIFSMLL